MSMSMRQRRTRTSAMVATAFLFLKLSVWFPECVAQVNAAKTSPTAVTVFDAQGVVTMANGILSVRIDKKNANILSLEYNGREMVDGSGYWNVYGNTPGGPKTEQKSDPMPLNVTQNPDTNGGSMGEFEINMPYQGRPGKEPLDIAIRYGLRRGDSGLYCSTSLTHKRGYPAFNVEISTVTLKLKSDVFNHLNIDSRRDKQMITAEDWIQGKPLNLKEARLMTTGIHQGEVEHKYDYSAVLAETPAWGWTSTTKHVGIWYVVPSLEYINGPPTKVELTGHVDLRDSLPADPTLLFIWHGSHYGGVPIYIDKNEEWNKVVGPFVIYCNTGSTPDDMWKDALTRAKTEKKAWPYVWMKDPGYATPRERGAVSGLLVVKDVQQPRASAAKAWVGLAAAPYQAVTANGKEQTISWQLDGKHYEYWVHAAADGSFAIPAARAGNYVLYAFDDGILGEFSKANVTVTSGRTVDLGRLTWTPVRYGRQVWEIGRPDRSAAEFRHGDHYWTWGLYNKYPQEFPNDVNFIVGKSNPAKDWNYAQPPVKGEDGTWHGTTWRVTFHQDHAGTGKAVLRLAVCGSRGNSLEVAVNGKTIGLSDLPNSGVMHRDGIRAIETEEDYPFDAALLTAGENHIELTTHAKDWTDGVLYDYLRLEVGDSAVR